MNTYVTWKFVVDGKVAPVTGSLENIESPFDPHPQKY